MVFTLMFYLFSLTNSFETTQLPPSGNPAPARLYHCVAYIPSEDALILFGGQQDTSTLYDDLWIYYFIPSMWKKLETVDGVKPRNSYSAARYNHGCFSAVLDGALVTISPYGEFCVFGGANTNGILRDLWCYSLQARVVQFM